MGCTCCSFHYHHHELSPQGAKEGLGWMAGGVRMASLDLLGLQDTQVTLERLATPEHQVEFFFLPCSMTLVLTLASKVHVQIDLPWIPVLQVLRGISMFSVLYQYIPVTQDMFLSLVTIWEGFLRHSSSTQRSCRFLCSMDRLGVGS